MPTDSAPVVVWSFWSKPFQASHGGGWASERAFLCSWVLSVETARKHYAHTRLYTDDAGARLLVDHLQLPFERYSTALNALEGCDPRWRSLGKLHTYAMQDEPFVHVDSDVYLWKPLPERLLAAPVLAQSPEPIIAGRSPYVPERAETAIERTGGWLPEEWIWYRSSGLPPRGESCGIVGGRRVDFIQHYAQQGLRLATAPADQAVWAALGVDIRSDLLAEQFLLAACVEYHRGRTGSPFRDVSIEYLFESPAEAWSADAAALAGYTHLLGAAKGDAELVERLENRVEREYPNAYGAALRVSR